MDAPGGSSLFTGRGTLYTLETSEIERISHLLEHHGLSKWGFVIYRCTYEDDSAWARFMERMNDHRATFLTWKYEVEDPDDDVPRDVAKRLDWRVQEDPATLKGASKDEVRRRFRQLVTTSLKPEESGEATVTIAAKSENPRWNFCVHVDKASLDSILQDSLNWKHRYVNLIRADDSWDNLDYDHFDWSSYTPLEEDDEHDDREEEIEGSRRADVGWMKVRVGDLVPGLYCTLMKDYLWDDIYVRPPDISRH